MSSQTYFHLIYKKTSLEMIIIKNSLTKCSNVDFWKVTSQKVQTSILVVSDERERYLSNANDILEYLVLMTLDLL